MVCTGLSEFCGSWGTRPTVVPRNLRHWRSFSPVTSRPAMRTLPVSRVAESGRSPITAAAVVDLPEPDSPTMAVISPGWTSRSTPRTACTGPRVPA